MSELPQGESLYMRARTPPPTHPAPNNVGLVMLLMTVTAIVAAVALVGPGAVGEVRQMAYCMGHQQEAAC